MSAIEAQLSEEALEEGAFEPSTAAVKTLLLLDLVDSTALLQKLGDARADELFGGHDRLARALLAVHDGQEIDKTDGFLLLFERPIHAVRFALDYHQQVGELGRRWGVRLLARAGIHLGEVFLRRNPPADISLGAKPLEVEGLAKHAAARLMSLAQGGQTLLTHAAFDLARRAAGEEAWAERPRWLAHGSYRFQGLSEALEVFEVGIEGRAPLSVPPDTAKVRRAVAASDELTLGWRPAAGHPVPWRHHWVLERKLGEGGFGEVWLAHQEKTGDQRVFKFCHQAERLRALRREVTLFRILKTALGERDDIGRVLDWNFKESPFFLELEYSGADLARWAEARGGIAEVPLPTRLEIVAQVATALAAAHSVGVLHKDIKPDNVLIVEDSEGRPKVRLSDFGIGMLSDREKLLRHGIAVTGLTELANSGTSSLAGTRLYVAPELLEGKPPTTQSDIFALGVLLYQMVVGHLRHALAPGWERHIGDELLREDVARCVDGTPARRFAGAFELADHLHGLDVRRRERAAERRRERDAEQTRTALARARRRRYLLAAFTILVTMFALAMALQMRRTAEEAERANREAEAARQVSDFLVGLFEEQTPDAARGNTVTAREILDRGVERIRSDLRGQPEIRATLLHTMGRVYHSLGLFEPAATLLQDAQSIRRDLYGDDHPSVVESLLELGDTLHNQGAYDEAERVLEETRRLAQGLGEDHPLLASSSHYLGGLHLERGRLEEADRYYREAIAALDAGGETMSWDRGEILNGLAVTMHYLGRNAQAWSSFEGALAVWRELAGEEHTDYARTLSNKGAWLISVGRYNEAESCLRESLAIKEKLLGDRHPFTAPVLYKLAHLGLLQGRFSEAEARADRALEILGHELDEDHWRVAFTRGIRAASLAKRGLFAEAEEPLLTSYQRVREARGPRAAASLALLELVVDLYEDSGRPAKADRYRALLTTDRPSALSGVDP